MQKNRKMENVTHLCGGFIRAMGAPYHPLLASPLFSKSLFPVSNTYSSLSAFAINDDGADALSPLPKNLWIRHCRITQK